MRSGIISSIVSRTIEQDQEFVANVWAETFHHNQVNTPTEITRMVMACIAAGQFEVRTDLDAKFSAPANVLTIADYLSHASRIIIDFSGLSDINLEQFKNYFPVGIETCIIKRPATHDIQRDVNGSWTEGKGFMIGVAGFLSHACGYDINDHGMDIAMGGLGQTNFVGEKIAEDGRSGHVYFHLKENDKGLMIGLEQTSPHGGVDQFGQGHSMFGASDTFTAAGSVYFDNEIYKAKLLLEKQALPPRKYGGMRVKINDNNFEQIDGFVKSLKRADSPQQIKALLLQKPTNAVERAPIDFVKLNLHRITTDAYKFLIRDDASLSYQMKNRVANWLVHPNDVTVEQLFKKDFPEHPFIHMMKMKDDLINRQIVAERGAEYQQLREQYLRSMHDMLQADCRQLIRTINNVCNNIAKGPEITREQKSIMERLNQVKDQLESIRDKKVTLEDDWQFIEVDSENMIITEEIVQQLQTVTNEARGIVEAITSPPPITPPATISLEDEIKLKVELGDAKIAITKLTGENDQLKQTLAYDEKQYSNNIAVLNNAVLELNNSNNLLKAEIARLEQEAKQNEIAIATLQAAKQTELVATEVEVAVEAAVAAEAAPTPNTEKRTKDTENFNELIGQLLTIAKRLPSNGTDEAGDEAFKLANELDTARFHFINSKESDDKAYNTFKSTCQTAIDKPKKLYQHTEARQIVNNILLAILGLGLFYGIAVLINRTAITGNWLFFNDIDKTRKALVNEVQLPKIKI